MTRPVLVLRPQPGADATARGAVALGLEAIIAPLFRIVSRRWEGDEMRYHALLVTSANAVRHIGGELSRGRRVYAVGEATAAALREAGFQRLVVGKAGVKEVLDKAERDGVGRLLHLTGEDRTPFEPGRLQVDVGVVYAAEPLEPDTAFQEGLQREAVVLLHSDRAARRFRELAGTGHRIVAISSGVLNAAGQGWVAEAAANRPTDHALLAAAARLCQ